MLDAVAELLRAIMTKLDAGLAQTDLAAVTGYSR